MSKNINSKLFKSIISVMLMLIIVSTNLTCVLGATSSSSKKKVTPRNLAMFSCISYANLEKIKNYSITVDNNYIYHKSTIASKDLIFKSNKMVSDAQLRNVKIDTSLGTLSFTSKVENASQFLFNGMASTAEVSDWYIVNYTKYEAPSSIGPDSEFAAMTFKRGNDIVIAYRGTEVNIGDINNDFLYGLTGVGGQEGLAQDYAIAIADHYAKYNNNINIYVTGWSLGGYLAQFGGAALLENSNYKDNVKAINYFNGIGLDYFYNFRNLLKPILPKKIYNVISNLNSKINKIQTPTLKTLNNWYKKRR